MIFDELEKLKQAAPAILPLRITPTPVSPQASIAHGGENAPDTPRDPLIINFDKCHSIGNLASSLCANEAKHDLEDFRQFEKCIKRIIPETLFFVGDVRGTDGANAGSDTILIKLMGSMHALRRILSTSANPKDQILNADFEDPRKTIPLSVEKQFKICQDLKEFALDDVRHLCIFPDSFFTPFSDFFFSGSPQGRIDAASRDRLPCFQRTG